MHVHSPCLVSVAVLELCLPNFCFMSKVYSWSLWWVSSRVFVCLFFVFFGWSKQRVLQVKRASVLAKRQRRRQRKLQKLQKQQQQQQQQQQQAEAQSRGENTNSMTSENRPKPGHGSVLGGLDEQYALVRDMIEVPLRSPEIFDVFGVAPPRGVLLFGASSNLLELFLLFLLLLLLLLLLKIADSKCSNAKVDACCAL